MKIKNKKTIKIHKKYKQIVKDKLKTSTIITNCNVKEGDIITLTYDEEYFSTFITKNIAKAKIDCIQRIRFDEISRDMAVTEGYVHECLCKDDLKNEIWGLEDSTLLYYVKFTLIE